MADFANLLKLRIIAEGSPDFGFVAEQQKSDVRIFLAAIAKPSITTRGELSPPIASIEMTRLFSDKTGSNHISKF